MSIPTVVSGSFALMIEKCGSVVLLRDSDDMLEIVKQGYGLVRDAVFVYLKYLQYYNIRKARHTFLSCLEKGCEKKPTKIAS
ncbi:hypothetical protein RYX36_025413, partial [Vicia faba]